MLLQVFVTSGLGGMSGAQAKAAVIAGCVGVVAEVHKMLYCINSIWGGSKTSTPC